MKKTYTFLLSFFVGILTLTSQVNIQKPNMVSTIVPSVVTKTTTNNKTVSCIDTIQYPQGKQTGVAEIDPTPMDFSTYISGTAQVYYLANSGTVHGLTTYMLLDLDGVPGNTPPVNIIIGVYNIDANNYPTTVIELDTVLLSDVGFNYQTLMFNSPVAVSDSFALTIEIDGLLPSNPYYVTNTSANNDGQAQALSCIEDQASGVWYNAYIDYAGTWDMDMLISPIFEKSITASYTSDVDSICPGSSVIFNNTSVVDSNYMFNLYDSLGTYIYKWNYDDGTGMYNHEDTTYTFSMPGTYNTQLLITNYGYTTNCVDSAQLIITVHDTAVANFGFTQGGVSYMFYDSSSYAYSYSWDFGDSSPLDSSQNPIHTYSIPGNYQTCLTVADTFGCSMNTFCDSVYFTVGIDDYFVADDVKIYPIPANKYFNVTVPKIYFGGEIVVTDVVGKNLKSVTIENHEKVKILADDIASGVYFVSIEYNGERIFTKRIIIDR